jgi:hypothetical protein
VSNAQSAEQPNILWLVSEDNSPFVGAYGDDFASTPNIDKLASESFVYTRAYANAPVCAPSRNTIISGIYATSAGQQHQRSYNRKSDAVVLLPQYLREAGYYTTNDDKEDYNISLHHLDYLWQAASMRSWEETCRLGDCNALQASHWKAKPAEELYDTANDPWEVNNLVDDPAYADALERMREVLSEWTLEIRDSGFIPEADLIRRAGDVPIYDYMRSGDVPLERIIEAAETATTAATDDLSVLAAYLQSDDSAIRYWGATGLLMAGDEAASAMEALRGALDDPSPNVVVVASEALYNLGEQTAAREGFMRVLQSTNPMARTHAMNAIEAVEDDSDEIRQEVIEFARAAGVMTRHNYDHRSAKRLLDLWSVDLAEHGIEAEW